MHRCVHHTPCNGRLRRRIAGADARRSARLSPNRLSRVERAHLPRGDEVGSEAPGEEGVHEYLDVYSQMRGQSFTLALI